MENNKENLYEPVHLKKENQLLKESIKKKNSWIKKLFKFFKLKK